MFQLVRTADDEVTGLPVYNVVDAAEYNNPAVRHPYVFGQVWAVGERGVTGAFFPTAVRFQATGSYALSPDFPAGAYADAARALIAQLDS